MEKIKEKLRGGSSSDSNKLEKSQYGSGSTGTSSATSKIQNPISSHSGPTGSAVDSSSYGRDTSSYGSNTGSSYPQDTSGYTATAGETGRYAPTTATGGTTDRMPGSYVNEEDHIPSSTTSTSRTGPNQPYDPYSSKGQETAARAGTTSSTSRMAEDPSISRSREGGVLNQQTEQYHSSASPTTSGSHHYGRDAAIAGGAGALGAGGVGAYEYNKDQSSNQPLTQSSGQPGHQGQYQDVSYMQQSQPAPVMNDSSMGSTGATSMGSNAPGGGVTGESPGLTQARKMGGAYEAGYRDAMEHMQQEMRSKGPGSGQAF